VANQWLRLWHDMPTDPKWRTISRVSKQRIGDVMSVYVHLLVVASSSKTRGSIIGARSEDIATALDMETNEVDAVLQAMEGRVLGDGLLLGWETRQPLREDGANGSRGEASDNYIYFVAATNSDVVKLGFSKNPWSRLKDLQGGSAEKYSVLATLKTPNRSEAELHELFKLSRKNGEWFARTEALNLLISNIKNKYIVDYEGCIKFLKSLDSGKFLVATNNYGIDVVTTKDKDKTREDKELIPSLSDSANPTDPAIQNQNPEKPESKKSAIPPCPFDALIDAYEAALPSLPSVTRSLFRDGVNGKATAQRWAWVMVATHEKGKKKGERLAVTQQDGIDWFTRFFDYAAGSDFLTGANGKFTGCSMGWLMAKSNFEKVLAGNYHMDKAA